MNKPGVMIYFNMIPSPLLPDADRLRLYDAMMEYGRTGKEPEFEGVLAVAWGYVAPILDLDDARYEQVRAKRALAGKLSGIARQKNAPPDEDMQENESKGTNVRTQTISYQNTSEQKKTNERESLLTETTRSPKRRFIPPLEEEVSAYVIEAGLNMDPMSFLDYYSANGWKIGGHSVKDWKAAARNWARREDTIPRRPEKPQPEKIVLAPDSPYDVVY